MKYRMKIVALGAATIVAVILTAGCSTAEQQQQPTETQLQAGFKGDMSKMPPDVRAKMEAGMQNAGKAAAAGNTAPPAGAAK